MKPLNMIVAMTPDGVIAVDGKIPWRIAEDLKRFKALTTWHPIIMGRKTFESIGRPLPNRANMVVTRDVGSRGKKSDGTEWFNTLEDALASAERFASDGSHGFAPPPFIIGGGEIYALALPFVTRLEITYVARPEHRASPSSSNVTLFPFARPDEQVWIQASVEQAETESGDAISGVEYHAYERRK